MPQKKMTLAEAKSRVISPARSAYDFRVNDTLLIKTGDQVVTKIVKATDPAAGIVTAVDGDGKGDITVNINPDSPEKDSDGEFKYWIDETGEQPVRLNLRAVLEDDGVVDPTMGDAEDVTLGTDVSAADTIPDVGLPPDVGAGSMVGEAEDEEEPPTEPMDTTESRRRAFARDMKSFLGEDDAATTSQVPDNTVGGAVDDSEHADEVVSDDDEPVPAPVDPTGSSDGGEVDTMAGDASSNVPGSAPEDEVDTHGDVGGTPQSDSTMPTTGEHSPDTPDKAQESRALNVIREDIRTALRLARRGADPKVLAPRLLRGA